MYNKIKDFYYKNEIYLKKTHIFTVVSDGKRKRKREEKRKGERKRRKSKKKIKKILFCSVDNKCSRNLNQTIMTMRLFRPKRK